MLVEVHVILYLTLVVQEVDEIIQAHLKQHQMELLIKDIMEVLDMTVVLILLPPLEVVVQVVQVKMVHLLKVEMVDKVLLFQMIIYQALIILWKYVVVVVVQYRY